jgi:nicotinate-nucleotide adenylyltransferase
MRVGILGGTFDPIHLGHVVAARIAATGLALDEVWLVPAGHPPHRGRPHAGALDRFAMVSLVASAEPLFVPSTVELERSGPSYTVDTVQSLCQSRPEARFHLIVGSDTLPEMGSWRELARLVAMCRVAVVTRPGVSLAGPLPGWADAIEGEGLDLSATRIRQVLSRRESVSGLVTDAVATHIFKRGLYR